MRATPLPHPTTAATLEPTPDAEPPIATPIPDASTTLPPFYHQYDQQQRLHLTQSLAAFLWALTGAGTLVGLLYISATGTWRTQPSLVAALLSTGIVLTTVFWWCYSMARRQHFFVASGIIIGSVTFVTYGLSAVTLFVAPALAIPALIGFFSLSIALVLVALLGNHWVLMSMTAVNTLLVLATALVIIPAIPHQATDMFPQSLPVLGGIILLQWGLAALIGTVTAQYRQTYVALGEAYSAIERAKQLDDLKDQFISSVNHELRNPIMAMMNYVTVLSQRHETMPVPRRTQILGSLDQTGKRVIQLVGSILDVRVLAERPKDFTATAVNIQSTIQTAASLIDPSTTRMDERNLFIHIPADMEIWGSEIYLQQIFTNLLSNAVKYSLPRTSIEIRAQLIVDIADQRSTAERQQKIEITVRDFGLGIPPNQIALLFNRFVRLSRDLTSQTMGSGLGLYLCKVLTEAMGGRIWVESTGVVGEGSTFHLILPTVPTAEANAALAVPVMNRPSFAGFVSGMLASPAGRLRVAIGLIVAIFLTLSGILGMVQSRSLLPPMAGTVTFFDTPAGPSSGLRLQVTGLADPTNGDVYQAWFINTATEQIVPLGSLTAHGAAYTMTYTSTAAGVNIVATDTLLEVTLEHGRSLVPRGKVIVQGTFPVKASVHMLHLLASFPATPNKSGLLIGLRDQTRLLNDEAHQLASTATADPALAKCLVTGMLGIIESAQNYPLPATCQLPANANGDGYGLLSDTPSASSTYTAQNGGYIPFTASHTALTIQQSDSTAAMRAHGGHIIGELDRVTPLVKALVVELDALNSTPSDRTKVSLVVALADKIYNGTPSAGNAPPNNGVLAIYREGQLLASLPLVTPVR